MSKLAIIFIFVLMNKIFPFQKITFLILSLCLLLSCVSHKDIGYFQGIEDGAQFAIKHDLKPLIQKGDILSISVSSLSPEANKFFSFHNENVNSSSLGYLVDTEGMVEIPLIGRVKLEGLDNIIAKDTIRCRLEKYLDSPTVSLRIDNYRVTLLGEVNKPGVYYIKNDKISILEALGIAGDLSIYGKRKEIFIIREINGQSTFNKVDITSKDIFNTPFYYLKSGDVVYVNPNKAKVSNSGNFYRLAPLILSSLTVITLFWARVF